VEEVEEEAAAVDHSTGSHQQTLPMMAVEEAAAAPDQLWPMRAIRAMLLLVVVAVRRQQSRPLGSERLPADAQ